MIHKRIAWDYLREKQPKGEGLFYERIEEDTMEGEDVIHKQIAKDYSKAQQLEGEGLFYKQKENTTEEKEVIIKQIK